MDGLPYADLDGREGGRRRGGSAGGPADGVRDAGMTLGVTGTAMRLSGIAPGEAAGTGPD